MFLKRSSVLLLALTLTACDREKPATPPTTKAPSTQPAASTQPTTAANAKPTASSSSLVPLQLDLPKPLFTGTPTKFTNTTVDFTQVGKPRAPLMVPADVAVLSLKKPVKLSDDTPQGEASMVTDGSKDGNDVLEMGPGVQWAQVDLQKQGTIHAIAIWHFHSNARVYRDVVVQVADDPDFIENVRTVFNNDQDNSAGLGVGTDREYIEGYEGKLIPVSQLKARYVRAYSKGSTSDESNHLIEIEVWGTWAK